MLITSTRLGRHIAKMEEGKNALKILTGNPTGKMPLERRSRR